MVFYIIKRREVKKAGEGGFDEHLRRLSSFLFKFVIGSS